MDRVTVMWGCSVPSVLYTVETCLGFQALLCTAAAEPWLLAMMVCQGRSDEHRSSIWPEDKGCFFSTVIGFNVSCWGPDMDRHLSDAKL